MNESLTENMENTVTLSQILTPEFMRRYTPFESIEEFLSAGRFEINSEEDYDAIPDKDIDAHVSNTTKFASWKEMLTEASEDFLRNRTCN